MTQSQSRRVPTEGDSERARRRLEALSRGAVSVQEALTPDDVVSEVGSCLQTLGIHWHFATLAPGGDAIVLQRVSLAPKVVAAVEHLLRIRVMGLRVPVESVSPLRAAIREHRAVFFEAEDGISEVFPALPRPLISRLAQLIGARSLICAPLLARGRVLGTLTVWAPDLSQDDLPAVVVFAQQAATAYENAQLLQQERATRQQLDAILRGVNDGISVQDPSGQLVYANDAAARILGFKSAEALVGAHGSEIVEAFEMFNERAEPFPMEQLPSRRAQRGEVVENVTLRFRVRATGEEHWAMVGAAPIRDVDGSVRLVVNVFRNVTELKRAEERLRFLAEASAHLATSLDMQVTLQAVARAAVSTLVDWSIVYLVDADGAGIVQAAVAHADPSRASALEEFRRYPPVRGDSSLIWRVLDSGEPVLVPEVADEALVRGARDPEHLAFLRKLRLTSVMYVPLVARERMLGAIGLVTAESGRRLGPDDLTAAQEIARRAALALDNALLYREAQQAIHTREQFLSVASHELRNPVAAIRGATQLLGRLHEREQLDSERVARYLDILDDSSGRLAALTQDLLDVSRLQSGTVPLRPRKTDLAALVRQSVERSAAQAEAQRFMLHLACDPCEALVDPDRVDQIVTNLLDNALKYSPDGGEIHVSLRMEDRSALLQVQDQGIGFPPGATDRIFEPFGRAVNAARHNIPGLGMGLYICRQLAQQHGGRLWAESEGEGRGATFSLLLPVAQSIQDEGTSPSTD